MSEDQIKGLLDDKKFKEAADQLSLSSSPSDWYRAGTICESAIKDLPRAIELYEKAASMGFLEAFYSLGMLNLDADLKAAVGFLINGSNLGHHRCSLLLGTIYSEASNLDFFNPAAAFHHCKLAADLGNDPIAQVMVAAMYMEGEAVEQSPSMAAVYFEKAAINENPEACYQLALLKPSGSDAHRKWLEKASEKQHPAALFALATCYKESNNLDHAVRLFTYSAEVGYAPAQMELYRLFSKGDQVPKNDQIAMQWCGKAALGGDEDAIVIVSEKLISQEMPDAAEALLRIGCNQNSSAIKLKLANLLSSIPARRLEAIALLESIPPTDGLFSTSRALLSSLQ